jgi:predicted peptidase
VTQKGFRFSKEISVKKSVDLQYLLHLPESVLDPDLKWPLILFLHAAIKEEMIWSS